MPQPRKHVIRNVVRACCDSEWMIEQQKLEQICELLALREEGLTFTEDEVRNRIKAAGNEGDDDEQQGPVVQDGVAVLPLQGVLAPRMNLLMQISGGTSTQQFAQWFSQAMANPAVKAIVFDVDSPGGAAVGNEEVAQLIRDSRGKGKPITAVVTGMMASAAYYIGSAADEIVAAPSSSLGSIGTFMIHREDSRAAQNAGVNYSVIKAGEFKAVGNSVEPLTSQSRAVLQERVDDMNRMFVNAVASNRRVSPDVVEQNFGQGKTLLAPRAKAAGMADRIGTLDQVVREQQAANGTRRGFDIAVYTTEAGPESENRQSSQENRTMDPRVKYALAAKGLITPDASEAEAQASLRAFFSAIGQAIPQKAEETVEALFKPTAASSAAATEQTAAGGQGIATPPNAASREQQAAIAERARIEDLRARGSLLGISQEDVQAAIDGGASVEQSLVKWTEKRCKENAPVSTAGDRIEGGAAAGDKFHQAAVEALGRRVGIGIDKAISGNARSLEHKTMYEVAVMSLQQMGVRTMGDRDDIASLALRGGGDTLVIRAGATDGDGGFGRPGDFPNILSALAGKMMDIPAEYFPSTYRQWAYQIPSVPDFKPKTIMAVGEFGELPRVPDGDDFQGSNTAEEASFIAADSYGDEWSLTPRMVVDDDLGAFEEAARDKVIAHDMTLNRLCVDLLTGNVVAGDGNSLFDNTNHGNDVTAPTDVAALGKPDATQLAAMRLKLRKQKGVSAKRKLNLKLATILIPEDLETSAQQLLSTTIRVVPVTTATGEIFRGVVDYLVEPQLADHSVTEYYGFADKRFARSIIYCHQTGFETMKSRLYFNPKNNSRVLQVEGRFAAAVRNWRGVIRNVGA